MARRRRQVLDLGPCGYEVVRDGAAARLEGPLGTLSYFHPRRPFTGCAWDAHTAATLLSGIEAQVSLIQAASWFCAAMLAWPAAKPSASPTR